MTSTTAVITADNGISAEARVIDLGSLNLGVVRIQAGAASIAEVQDFALGNLLTVTDEMYTNDPDLLGIVAIVEFADGRDPITSMETRRDYEAFQEYEASLSEHGGLSVTSTN